jgi:hypothetical protein
VGDAPPVTQEVRLPTDVDGLTAATRKLDEMISRVDKLERATQRHHKKTEAGWEGVEHSVNKAKNAVHEFMGFIGAALVVEGLEKVADKFIEIGKEALRAAAMAERMNFAIDAAAGGKEAGAATRHWLEENSKHSEFTEAQNENAYLFLKRYGVGQQKAGLFMKGAEDLAAVAGPEQREAVYQEALSALARVHARGKIDTRSAMRLGIGVEDFATLPQFKGQSTKAIAKAMQAGNANVSENDLLNLIMHRTGEKAIGEKSADASQLLLTRMSKLAELPERFYKRLGETSAAKKLSDSIAGIIDKLDPDSPTGKKIFGALESTFDSIADSVAKIDFDAVANTLTEDVFPALKAMAGMIQPTIDAVERVLRGFHEMHDIAFGAAPKSAALDEFDRRTKEAKGADAHPEWLTKKNRDLGEGFRAVGSDFSQGFGEGMSAGNPFVHQKADTMGREAVEGVKESTETHSPSRKAAEVGEFFGEGYALGIERSSGRIADAIDSTFRVPAGMFSSPSVAGLGGGVSVTFGEGAIQIVIQGGDKDAAAAVRDELARAIRPMLVDILEETRGGGGNG